MSVVATVTIPVRVNGLQYPPSRDQIKTLIIYPATILSSFLIIRVTLSDYNRLMVLLMTLNGALSVFLILAWISVSYIDPEQKEGPSGIPVICYSSPDKSARFCGACRKTVPGLDHHCTWLNTCIGRRNYVPFICLVFIGAAQSALNAIIGFITAAVWITNGRTSERITKLFGGKIWTFYLAVCTYTAMSTLIAAGLLALALFHTYLMICMGMGTFDWLLHRRGSFDTIFPCLTIIRNLPLPVPLTLRMYDASIHDDIRDPEISVREKKKQQEREEWQRIINHPRKKKITKESSEINLVPLAPYATPHGLEEQRNGNSICSADPTGPDSIRSKRSRRYKSREFELGSSQASESRCDVTSTSIENRDLLNSPLKIKVTRKSFCVQKEPNFINSSASRQTTQRNSDRFRPMNTVVESHSCNDLTDVHFHSTSTRSDADVEGGNILVYNMNPHYDKQIRTGSEHI